jgi:hypothetical protein
MQKKLVRAMLTTAVYGQFKFVLLACLSFPSIVEHIKDERTNLL